MKMFSPASIAASLIAVGTLILLLIWGAHDAQQHRAALAKANDTCAERVLDEQARTWKAAMLAAAKVAESVRIDPPIGEGDLLLARIDFAEGVRQAGAAIAAELRASP